MAPPKRKLRELLHRSPDPNDTERDGAAGPSLANFDLPRKHQVVKAACKSAALAPDEFKVDVSRKRLTRSASLQKTKD
jgi:hypothetical protein